MSFKPEKQSLRNKKNNLSFMHRKLLYRKDKAMTDKPIFISYRSIEQDFALQLARDVLQAGYPVWMDRLHGILPGDEWRHSLEQGVNNSVALLACLSPNYVDSTWCRRELQRADSLHKPIFPVLIGPVADDRWPLEIQDKQYADFRNWTDAAAYQAGLTALLAGIEKKGLLKSGPPIAFPPPDEPDPARDDPEDQAGRGLAKAAQLEQMGGFAAIEAEELRKDMEVWMNMYKAAAQQNRLLLDEAVRVKLRLQMETYKTEWKNLEKRLQDIEG
jgi:hypothetical protein